MRVIVLSISDDVSELHSLLETLDYEVVGTFVQKRRVPDIPTYFGSGKIAEVVDESNSLDFEKIVVNDELKPSQQHHLEMAFQRECIDRVGIILRIFADHAHTPEAIAQVQLARLRYELPFLREWIHKAKRGERPGFLAGGAYATDVYYEHARAHVRQIERRLLKLSRERKMTRELRKERGRTLVSLSGYTNAGKSALMNIICGSDVDVSPQMFSSLSTTTRRVKDTKESVLMIDTVGFIENLPPDLVNAFKSTLEEIFSADLILMIVDVSESDEEIRRKVRTCFSYLEPHIEGRPLIIVGSKTDIISRNRYESANDILKSESRGRRVLLTSSVSGAGIEDIMEVISEVQNRTVTVIGDMPLTDASYSLLSQLHEAATITHSVQGKVVHVELSCSPEDASRIEGRITAAGGTVRRRRGNPRLQWK